MHVLIAEDNELNYEVAHEILAMHGITSEQAENGKICVERFMEAPEGTYDAILMDMQMPVMNGLEATKMLRKNGSVPWKYDTDHSHDSECCQNGYGQVSCGRDDRPSG